MIKINGKPAHLASLHELLSARSAIDSPYTTGDLQARARDKAVIEQLIVDKIDRSASALVANRNAKRGGSKR